MRNILFYFLISTALLFSYQNCSNPEVAFKTLSSTDPNQTLEVPVDENKVLVTENLGIKTTSRNIDFVWVIDNSGSMNAEAQAVNNNYQAFMESISSRGEIKSSLISSKKSTAGVTLPSGLDPNNHKQFDQFVSSNDPLSRAVGSILTKKECYDSPSSYYNSTSTSNCDRYVHTDNNREFLRVNSKKIFVFVTDDDEAFTNYTKFLNAFNTAYPGQSPIAYSFIGVSNSSTQKCYSRLGRAYEELSMNTKGGVFDVCKTNWSSHFSDMINHVFVATENIFNIKHENFEEIVEVMVDDKKLSADQYTVNNSTITVNPSLLSESSKRVTIKYTVLK